MSIGSAMKKKLLLIFLVVIGVSFFCETVSHAVSLELNSSQTFLSPGDLLTVDIIAKDAANVSGALFTLEFPASILELEATPVTTDFFESQSPFDQGVADSFWTANTAIDGEVYLSGFVVNNANEQQIPPDESTLFSVHFRVKTDALSGTSVIRLSQSNLCNGPAGWGTDLNNNGAYDAGDTYEKAAMLYAVRVDTSNGQRIDSTEVKTDVLLETVTPAPQWVFTVSTNTGSGDNDGGGIGPDILITPGNDTANVSLSPLLEIASYPNITNAGVHAAIIWQISRTESFNDLVFEFTGAPDVTSIRLPDFILDAFTTYFWQIQYSDGTVRPDGWIMGTFTTGPPDMVDSDGNGIPDSQDVSPAENLFGTNNAGDIEKVLKTEDGGLQYRLIAGSRVEGVDRFKWMKKEDVAGSDTWPVDFPFGLLSFRLYTKTPGASVSMTMQFSNTMPPGAAWWKTALEKGVYDYSPNAKFSANMKSAVITLTDGGPGDADGVANGVIVDPGGIVKPGGSDGSLACFIDVCMP